MALEGSLKEFNLADILQLIYFQKKTGVLALQGRDDKVRLVFHEGNIIGADSKKRGTDNRLGNVLVKRGVLKQEALYALIEKQKTEGGKLGSLIVREGVASREQIQEVITFQINEIMVQLFGWTEGRYEFTPQGVPIDKEVGVSLDTQHFLMEGLRMVDEWSTIGDKVTIDTVFVRTRKTPPELSLEENEILALVDGEADVGGISDFSGKDSFSVSATLLGLQEKGVVTRRTPKEIEEEDAEKRPAPRAIPGLAFVVSVLLFSAFAFSLYFAAPGAFERAKPFEASERVDALRYSVEAHFEENGSYPPGVKGEDPWGNPYVYNASESGFELYSTGPDGKPGTGDDIH